MQRVFVVDPEQRPLMPCRPARARQLLTQHCAAVYRYQPFTIILREARPEAVVMPLRLKIDPGSVTTGLAILQETSGEVVWAAELRHRGEDITTRLLRRRACRRARRQRKNSLSAGPVPQPQTPRWVAATLAGEPAVEYPVLGAAAAAVVSDDDAEPGAGPL